MRRADSRARRRVVHAGHPTHSGREVGRRVSENPKAFARKIRMLYAVKSEYRTQKKACTSFLSVPSRGEVHMPARVAPCHSCICGLCCLGRFLTGSGGAAVVRLGACAVTLSNVTRTRPLSRSRSLSRSLRILKRTTLCQVLQQKLPGGLDFDVHVAFYDVVLFLFRYDNQAQW